MSSNDAPRDCIHSIYTLSIRLILDIVMDIWNLTPGSQIASRAYTAKKTKPLRAGQEASPQKLEFPMQHRGDFFDYGFFLYEIFVTNYCH